MTIPNTHLDILEGKGFAHWATIGPSGEPHSSPVWFDWDGEHFAYRCAEEIWDEVRMLWPEAAGSEVSERSQVRSSQLRRWSPNRLVSRGTS